MLTGELLIAEVRNVTKKKRRIAKAVVEQDSDEHFAFIAGYTSGGVPYGLSWEEVGALPHVDAGDEDLELLDIFQD
jgi:hypothetical protein